MTTPGAARSPLARTGSAVIGITAVLASAWAAGLAARHLGATAGAALITTVFAACWITRRVLHPVRRARTCKPAGHGTRPGSQPATRITA